MKKEERKINSNLSNRIKRIFFLNSGRVDSTMITSFGR